MIEPNALRLHPQLQHIFTKIERQRRSLLDQLKEHSTEKLNRTPAAGKWSVSQIIAHLIVAEQLSVNYMKKKIQGVEQAEDSGIREEVKMLLLKLSQRLPGLKFKAPRHVVENTPAYKELETLQGEWNKTRTAFRELLDSVNEQHLNRKIYKHARVGYLNVKHAALFFGEHVTHHTPQIKRLIK